LKIRKEASYEGKKESGGKVVVVVEGSKGEVDCEINNFDK